MKEIWKDIKGWEGFYQISNLGRVKSLSRYIQNNGAIHYKKERLLTPYLVGNGYLSTRLSRNGHYYNVKIHRLVAEAFILNQKRLSDINHKNGIKIDNVISNLEWVYDRENISHGWNTKIKSSKCNGVTFDKARNKWLAQIQINKHHIHLGRFSSEGKASKAYKQKLMKSNLINRYAK